ncbi:hypothetical protein [Paenibacillus naphthalenovorans]|uniref:hypothetical protein n=1 Tax=Paenibacillus naphthalenovorans TaxID=162209 RepID=UPI003D2BB3BD
MTKIQGIHRFYVGQGEEMHIRNLERSETQAVKFPVCWWRVRRVFILPDRFETIVHEGPQIVGKT